MSVSRGAVLLVALAAVATLSTPVAGCSSSCRTSQAVFDGAIFVGTVRAVAADGNVTLHVESVEVVDDQAATATQPPGGTGPDPSTAGLRGVVAGATLTVQFPKAQVDHLRRDIGKRYRVVAFVDATERAHLKAEVQDMDVPCGSTVAVDG